MWAKAVDHNPENILENCLHKMLRCANMDMFWAFAEWKNSTFLDKEKRD